MRGNRSLLCECVQRMIHVFFQVIVPMWVDQGMIAERKHFETICNQIFSEIPNSRQHVIVYIRLDLKHELFQCRMSVKRHNDSRSGLAEPYRWGDRQF